MRLVDQLLELTPERYSSVAWLQRTPDGTLSRTWTWREIKQQTACVVSFLLDHAISPGDRVANLGRNSLDWALLDLACSAINAIHVPLDMRMSSDQLKQCLEQVGPSIVFSEGPQPAARRPPHAIRQAGVPTLEIRNLSDLPASARSLESLVQPYAPEDAANILFTSGTTGAPRGVTLSHLNLVSNARAKLDAMPQFSHDHRLNFLPFSHAYARTCELSTWLMSYSSIEVTHGIDGVLTQGSICKPTLINGVPLFYERLCATWNAIDGSKSALHSILGKRIRQLASGGAAIPDTMRAKLAAIGLPVYQGYGLTESSPVICSNRAASLDGNLPANLVEVGPPVMGVQVRVDNESRLWVRGDGVMLGYWKDTEATRAKIVDGWLNTGDLAEYVESNQAEFERSAIRILGRADDTIVLSNGYKIEPMPIERIINAQPWVSNCLLVGSGLPNAILILRLSEPGLGKSSSEILSNVQALLASVPQHAIPRKVLLIQDPWTSENGLANFKGGLRRKQIETQLRARIQSLHCETAILSRECCDSQ